MATETEQEEGDKVVVSPLEQSDEDFLKGDQDYDTIEEEDETGADPDEDGEVGDAGNPDEDEDKGTDTDGDDDDTSDGDDQAGADDTDDLPGSDEEEKEKDGDPDEDGDEEKSDNKDGKKSEKDDSTVDYKAEYEKLLTPFRANGRDMSVTSVDEALTLMSMGANYVKKMSAIKPNLKYIKMLDNNDLLDEDKLSFYIDLDKKDPAAIQKFIKDSGIDPLDINVKDDSSYTKNTAHVVDDKEVELDGILEDIQETESFQDTIDIIGKKWDSESQNIIANEPGIIKILNDQVSTGIFKQISVVVERKRTLGELTHVSDIAAYKQVGDAMAKAGAFKPVAVADQATTVDKPSVSKKKKADDSKLKSRKKAASSTKGSSSGKKADFNPLSMSDAEFEAMDEKLLNYK